MQQAWTPCLFHPLLVSVSFFDLNNSFRADLAILSLWKQAADTRFELALRLETLLETSRF